MHAATPLHGAAVPGRRILADANETIAAALKNNIAATAGASLFLYVIVAVLQQSDAELILPSSVFDLGGLLGNVKDGIPGGAVVAPLLQVKIPLALFYTLGPVALLLFHAAMVLNPVTLATAATPVRWLAIWLAPVALALIRWRFAPYVSARPEPPPVGRAMEALQTVALACDTGIVMIALLLGAADAMHQRHRLTRMRSIMARACRHAAMIWLVIVLGAGALSWLLTAKPGEDAPAIVWVCVPASLLLLGWLTEGRLVHRPAGLVRRWPGLRSPIVMEDFDLAGRTWLLAIFAGLAALPSFARALDLSGQSLVARAPSDALIQTLLTPDKSATKWKGNDKNGDNEWVATTSHRIADARTVAWRAEGRGIRLARWNFPGGRFDRATMALIGLRGANLERASLDFVNMIDGDLSGARMVGASLRSALLDGADLTATRVQGANFSKASLTGAKLIGANPSIGPRQPVPGVIRVANDQSDANETTPCDPAKWPVELRTDFSGANLSGANITSADLTCANLSGVTMNGQTDVTKTILTGADLTGADLTDATLSGARFENAKARFVTMTTGTKLDQTNLQDADLQHASLRGVIFKDALNVNSVKFQYADVRCAVFPADFTGAHLDNAIITGARLAQGKDGTPGRLLVNAKLLTAKQSLRLSPPGQDDLATLSAECRAAINAASSSPAKP
jgi:uncharacterized protein YjbI with pentapeptide repeats